MKSLVLASALAMASSVMAKETITIGELGWPGSDAIQSVLKVVMEERLGVDTKIVAADQSVMYVGMDKGDGSIDVYPDLWIPHQTTAWNKYIAPGSKESILVNEKPYQAEQGFYIPGYIQDKYGITSVEQLADPKVAKLFDLDGDGKGNYWPGDPAWGGTNVLVVKAKSYGFDKYFKQMQVSDTIFKAQLKKAIRNEKAFVFYYWTPDWIHTTYDLRLLKEPEFTGYAADSMKNDPNYNPKGCWTMYQPSDTPDWLEKSNIKCAFPYAKIYVAQSKSLVTRAPKGSQFLKQVAFDPKDINDWVMKIARDKEDRMDVAKAWVKANPDKVDAWLKGIN